MDWWVQTSGRRIDYRFLEPGTQGEPERWWAPYLRYSAPEDPMYVVETGPQEWRVYMTALPADRWDGATPRRAIRNSLLVQGVPAQACVLANLLAGRLDGTLARKLCEVMPESLVEPWLSGELPSSDKLSAISKMLASEGVAQSTDKATARQYGSGGDEGNHQELAAAAVHAAQQGELGVFCWLNLLAQATDVLSIPKLGEGPLIVLLEDSQQSGMKPLPERQSLPRNPPLAGREKAPHPAGLTLGKLSWTSRQKVMICGLASVVALAFFLLMMGGGKKNPNNGAALIPPDKSVEPR